MNVRSPLISVVMPVYNRAAWVTQSIDSILRQTYPHWELILVNDGSTDETESILRAYAHDYPNIRLISLTENWGSTRATNIGLADARGEYFSIHDSDDISERCRFEKQIDFLLRHPEVDLVGCHAVIMDEHGKSYAVRRYPQNHDAIVRYLRHSCPFLHSSVVIKMSTIRRLQGYNEECKISSDLDLWYRAVSQFRAANMPEALVHYRTSPDQETHNVRKLLEMVLRVHRRYVLKPPFLSVSGVVIYGIKRCFLLLPARVIRWVHNRLYYSRFS